MNTNKKIILAVAGGILLLVFVFAAIMLFRGIRQFGVAEDNLATARSQLADTSTPSTSIASS